MVTFSVHHGHLVKIGALRHSTLWENTLVSASFDLMSTARTPAPGADWTKLLADPEIVSHLGELLQAYREAPPGKRDEALREAMRKIKGGSAKANSEGAAPPVSDKPSAACTEISAAQALATEPGATPPFEPDIFTPSWGQDRRHYPRVKCFVAVELGVEGVNSPVWGNLSNTSMGGCFVETATPVPPGQQVRIGLWVANGKLWVKGMILNGIITSSNPSFGVRIKFASLEAAERESLRHFLKYVESTTKNYHAQQGYLAQMKR